jgi:hypothetical protein
MTADAALTDDMNLVRKRRFRIRSVEDIVNILRQMKIEGCQCEIKLILRDGGVPTSAVVEEHHKFDPLAD